MDTSSVYAVKTIVPAVAVGTCVALFMMGTNTSHARRAAYVIIGGITAGGSSSFVEFLIRQHTSNVANAKTPR